jgi:mannan endo-1,4-beta-mannosidase
MVHNMIVTYSPDKVFTESAYMERYPGDDMIDIFGLDFYDGNKQNFKVKAREAIDTIAKIAESHHKIMTLSETGNTCLKDSLWWTTQMLPAIKGTPISYVLVWRNANEKHFFAPYPQTSSVDDFIEFKKSGLILFQNDIPNMYKE